MGRKDKPVSLEDGESIQTGQLMRQSRQAIGRSLSEMALLLGYTRGYLSMIENGHKPPTHDIVSGYEKVLGFESGQISQSLHLQHTLNPVTEQLLSYQKHLDILEQGVDVWNRWREDHLEIRPSLDRVSLGAIDLSGANLNSVYLTHTKLDGVNLSNADLSDAVIRQSYLSEANLSGANLSGANLSGANLNNAYLSETNLSGANLSGANLSGANLSGANLDIAYLSEANLSGANLSGANLSGANLSGANLTRADLSASNLTEVNLTGANLDITCFSRATVINTIFGNVDLRRVVGLETVQHNGPSTIGIDTIVRSEADIPEAFTRGAGIPSTFIEYMRALVNKPIEYYTCFISYSSKNQEFAERLYADLQAKGVRCWYAPEDLKIGDKFPTRIDEAIRVHDKLLLVLSEDSIHSPWVEQEVEAAFEKEHTQDETILFPIKLDNTVMQSDQAWTMDIRRRRHILDFTQWKQHDVYRKVLNRLLRDLLIPSKYMISRNRALVAETAVFRWLESLDYRPEQNKKRTLPDLFIIDKEGNRVGVEVKLYADFGTVGPKIVDLYRALKNTQVEVDKFLVVVVFPDEYTAKSASPLIAAIGDKPSNVSLVEGYIQHNEFRSI